jgi:RHS repeat-associated protein
MKSFAVRWLEEVRGGAMRVAAALVLAATAMAASPAEKVTHIHNDPFGNPVLATDASGNVVWKETYRPYGEKLNNQPASGGNHIGFAGKPFERASGLSYMGGRYYDPVLGRFMGVDPATPDLANVHSLNRYVYANNNPYRYVDPDGHSPIDVGFFIWDLGKLGMAVYSGNPAAMTEAGIDVVMSAVGVASPVLGAGQALKIARAAEHGVDLARGAERAAGTVHAGQVGIAAAGGAPSFDVARKAAFEKAGLTDPSKVQFSKVDPKTGTVVEFKGEGGAKVGYDGPHKSPGPHHDTQHISWQSAGKRGSGGAQRGNEPYSGPQHPSRPDRKDQ